MVAGGVMTSAPRKQAIAPDGTHPPIKALVCAAAAVSAIGGLIFGYDIGGSGGTFTMKGFREQMDWPPVPTDGAEEPGFVTDEIGWITSLFALGAVAGSIPSGWFTDKIGRKYSIILYSIVFTIAAVIMGCANSVHMLYAGRFIGGIGVGGLSMASTCYQSEIAPESIRGLLVALQQLSITFGIFLAALANVGLKTWSEGWRLSYCGNGFLSFALIILMMFCPESPRWLYKVGKVEQARAVLHKVRQDYEVDMEMDLIAEQEKEAQLAAQHHWSDLFKAANNMRYRTLVGIAITSFQQLTGINAIMYFAPVIFSDFLSTDMALIANLILMFVNFISTFITIACVDKYGRRSLLAYGAAGMTITLLVVCLLSSDLADYKNDAAVSWTIVGFCALYVVNFAFSWGPVGWIVPAEIFPLDLRGKGMSLTTSANWLWNFIIGKVTPELLRQDRLDLWGTFLFFAAWCIIMFVFTMLYVPETRLVALEEIDNVVSGFRRLPLSTRATKARLAPEDQLPSRPRDITDKLGDTSPYNASSVEMAPGV
ncbi:general substrate transporter [Tribonema minus]|uniref:Hexose transporter 1 n=1 Tax=Tribonema minus TaxID=303371 RepID=A0A836C7Y4_9STRA|nr:general substrate transporter [Tribonema minus]